MQLSIVDNRSGTNNPAIYFGIIGQTAGGEWGYVSASSGDFAAAPAPQPGNSFPATVDFMPAAQALQLNLAGPIIAGRCFLSLGQGLSIPISSVGFVGPDFLDTQSPNGSITYDKIEFTLNGSGLNCNTTCVDFFGLSLTLALSGSSAAGPLGFQLSRDAIMGKFGGVPVSSLVYSQRILSPGSLNGIDWLKPYIDECWKHWTQANPLELTVNGLSVSGYPDASGTFVFTGDQSPHTVGKPSSYEVFSCSGVFQPQGSGSAGAIDAGIKQMMVTAINRGMFTKSPSHWGDHKMFYRYSPPDYLGSNPYAAILHSLGVGKLCYAFAWDDVENDSTDMSGSPADLMTITLY
ncbi:beta-1,3-glucanase family protein [Radicibacter daui]|uniref:beta-1,3-glucanase family protein n=1 Tax=Radicibacter daui TaxID=3064829 RepID=UPI004046EB4A